MTSPEQTVKFKELYQDYEQAVSLAGTMLRAYGMVSRQFLDADKAAALLSLQLSDMRGDDATSS